MDVHTDPYAQGMEGLRHYMEGNHVQAAQMLEEAVLAGKGEFALTLADIYQRDLDGGAHADEEAAMLYIISLNAGDSDSAAYLNSLDPLILTDTVPALDRVTLIMNAWKKHHMYDENMQENEGKQ